LYGRNRRRRCGSRGVSDRRSECGERLSSTIERGRNKVVHWLDVPNDSSLFGLELRRCFENSKGERRDHIVAGDRTNLINRKIDRRCGGKKDVRQNRERDRDADSRTVKREP